MNIKILITATFLFFGIIGISQTLIPYHDSGKYGYCDVKGEVKIQAKYDNVELFKSDPIVIVKNDERKIIINKNGLELLSFPNKNEIQILHVTKNNMQNDFPFKRTKGDTLMHLRWIKINQNEYQLLNLNTNNISSIYHIETPKVQVMSSFSRHQQIHGFGQGYHIGKKSDNSYDILNTDGLVIESTQNKPMIHGPKSISFSLNDSSCLYNTESQITEEYPYKLIVRLIENKYIIVSNKEKKSRESIIKSLTSGRNRQKRKYGLISMDGQVLMDTVFQAISYHKGIYILKKNGNTFLSDLKNTLVDTSEYKSIFPLTDNLLKARRHDDRIKILELSGKSFFKDQIFDEFKFRRNQNYYTSKNGETVSVYDSTLNVEMKYAAEAIYRDNQRNDRYIVVSEGLNGIINSNKETIIPTEYDRSYYTKDNFIMLSKDDKKGLANSKGKIIFKPEFEEISIEMVQGDTLLRPKKNGLYACYNLKGEQLSDFTSKSSRISGRSANWHRRENSYHFTDAYGTPLNLSSKTFNTGYTNKDSVFIAVLYKGNRRDTINQLLIEGEKFEDWGKEFDSIVMVNIKQGLIAVAKENKQAIIDVQGNIISPLTEQNIIEINNGYFMSKQKDKYCLFDLTGQPIAEYDYISDSPKNGRRSVANIIPNQFYESIRISCFNGHQDTISKPQREYGYIDKFGEILIPLEYNSTSRYYENYVYLSKGYIAGQKQSFLADTLGEIIYSTNYDNLYPFNNTDKSGYYVASLKGKRGLIDLKGNTVIPFEYSAIHSFFEEQIISVRDMNNDWHLINMNNEILFSGKNSNKSGDYKCYKLANDRFLFFPDGKMGVIDLNGKMHLEIDSQDFKFVTIDDIEFFEVNMNKFKYYINKETLMEYRNIKD